MSNSRRVSRTRPPPPLPFSGPINNLAVVPIKAEKSVIPKSIISHEMYYSQTVIGLIQLANKLDEDGTTVVLFVLIIRASDH